MSEKKELLSLQQVKILGIIEVNTQERVKNIATKIQAKSTESIRVQLYGLAKRGYLTRITRGLYQLTEKGQSYLKDHPAPV